MLHLSQPLLSTPPPVAPQTTIHTPENQPAAPEYISVILADFERSIDISAQDEQSFARTFGTASRRSNQQDSPMARYLAREPREEPFSGLSGTLWGTQLRDCVPHHRSPTPEQNSRPLRSSDHKSSTISTPDKDGAVRRPGFGHNRRMLMRLGILPENYKIHSHATNDTSTTQTSSSLKSTRVRSLRSLKHAADEEQESLDNASDTGGPETTRKKRRGAVIPPRLYVCPWYFQDPNAQHFQVGERFEKCRTHGIKTDKLKEHVRRIHLKPAQCPKCGRRGDPGEIRYHMDKINCTRKEVIEAVDDETLRKEVSLTTRRNITWHVVFAILFPHHTPAPPEGAQYFVDENETVEQADMCPEHIAQVLVAQLNHTTTTLKRFLAEHGEGLATPNVVAAATKLQAIISSAPFIADSPPGAEQPVPGSTAPSHDDSRLDDPDLWLWIDRRIYEDDGVV